MPGLDSNGDPAIFSQPTKLSSDQHAESLQVPIGAKFVFVPPASTYYTRATGIVGAGSELNEITVDNIFFEQVWRNGRRMIPGVHYFKIPDNSLISSAESPSQKNNSFVLETKSNSIDVKISSEAENNNTKILSINSSDQKQNLFEKV